MTERYTYSYDSWGRPLAVTHRLDTLPAVVLHAYGYDAAGRLAGDGRNGDADLQTNYYDPYGECLPAGSAVDSDNPYKWVGKEYDDKALAYDFGARHYAPSIRRWLTPDPLCEKYYSISPYAYCAGNPVNLLDPEGLTIVLTGDEESVNQYLGMLYASTGIIYGIDDNNQLFVKQFDDSFQGVRSESLEAVIKSAIDSIEDYSITIVGSKNDDKDIFIDSYEGLKVDITDLQKIGEASMPLQGALIGHYLNEIQFDGSFDEAHQSSLIVETQIMKELSGADDIETRKSYPLSSELVGNYHDIIYDYGPKHQFVFRQGASIRSETVTSAYGFPITTFLVEYNGRLKSVKKK